MTRIPPNVRRQVFERDNYRCRLCGAKGGHLGDADLVAHHAIPEEEGGTAKVSNLVTLCRKDHVRYHRTGIPDSDLQSVDQSEYSIDLSEADRDIIGMLEQNGTSRVGEISESVGISREHCRRRLWSLMAEGIVDRWYDSDEWDLAADVENSARGKWPEKSSRAGKVGGYEVMRQLFESGYSREEIADAMDIHSSTVRVGINQAKAIDPPLYQKTASGETKSCLSVNLESLNAGVQNDGVAGEDDQTSDSTEYERLREALEQLSKVYQIIEEEAIKGENQQ